ncbi:MAG: hypothetical protein Q4G46_14950, partial [Propionibacteriaceae bacterium]|nr:hypothetical protein [Propionibacteriaceae bacterium]
VLTPSRAEVQLPPPPELDQELVVVELADLLQFFGNPARGLLKRRAQIYVGDQDEDVLDEIPIALDGLQQWAIGERMLQAHLAGADLADIRIAEFCRGEVPPRRRGVDVLNRVEHEVRQISHTAAPWLNEPATSSWVSLDLGRFRITGMISGLRDRTLVRVGYGRVRGKQRLQAWIELLALKAAHPSTPWRAVILGKGARGSILGPVAEVDARARLSELLQLWVRGVSELLPLPPNTAAAHFAARRHGGNQYAAADAWKLECDQSWRQFGLNDRLASLQRRPAQPQDGPGHGSAFDVLTDRVWAPLVAEEGAL